MAHTKTHRGNKKPKGRPIRTGRKHSIKSLLNMRESVLDKINREEMFQELNTEDHPIRDTPSDQEKEKSRRREKKLRIRLKNIKKLIGNLKGRGGGGSIKMPMEYSTKPRLIRKM